MHVCVYVCVILFETLGKHVFGIGSGDLRRGTCINFVGVFETEFHYVALDSLELTTLLSQPSRF